MITDDARPFIFNDYPEMRADKIARSLMIRYIVEGWPNIYNKNSAIEDLSIQHCAHFYNKKSLIVECGNHFDENSVKTTYSVIIDTLLSLNVINGSLPKQIRQECIMMDSMCIKEKEGHLSHPFKHLEKVKKDEILANYDDGTEIK